MRDRDLKRWWFTTQGRRSGGGWLPLLSADSLGAAFVVTRAQAGGAMATALAADEVTWNEYAADTARFHKAARRLLLEGAARTNGVRNPRFEGGTVGVIGVAGVLPTNVVIANGGGLTAEILSLTSVGNYKRLALKLSGTASGGTFQLNFDSNTDIVAAPSQVWSLSAGVRLDAAPLPPLTHRLRATARTVAGALVDTNIDTFIVPTATLARYQAQATLSADVTIARIAVGYAATLTPASSYDFTITIDLPQAEVGAFASSPILPAVGTPAASTREADSYTMPWLPDAGTLRLQGVLTVAASGADQAIFQLDDGTDADARRVNNATGTLDLTPAVVSGGATTIDLPSGTTAAGALFGLAASFTDALFAASMNGGPAELLSAAPADAPTTLRLGANAAGALRLWGELGEISFTRSVASYAGLTRLSARSGDTPHIPSTSDPTRFDDTDLGYALGDWWTSGGAVWTAARVSDDNAGWLRGSRPALAGDVASGLLAAYGMRRVVLAYTGPLYRVIRLSDTALFDVPQLADGSADEVAQAAFLGVEQPEVVTWYDQTGNGRHATFSLTYLTLSGIERPLIGPDVRVGNSPALAFSSPIVGNVTPPVRRALVLPAGVAGSGRLVSVVSLAQFMHSFRTAPIVELATATASQSMVWLQSEGTSARSLTLFNSNSARSMLDTYHPPGAQPIVSGFTSGSDVQLYAEHDISVTASIAINDTFAGGLIGASTVVKDALTIPEFGQHVQGALLIYGRVLTRAEYLAVNQSLCSHFEVPTQPRGRIVMLGDSITEGANHPHSAWGREIVNHITPRPRAYSNGFGGSRFDSELTKVNLWQATLKTGEPYNLAVLGWGSNDIAADAALATIQADRDAMIAAIKALSPSWKIALCTVIARNAFSSPSSREVTRLAFNTDLRANWQTLGADLLIDNAINPDLQDPTSVVFYSDGTHLTAAGQVSQGAWAGFYLDRWVDARIKPGMLVKPLVMTRAQASGAKATALGTDGLTWAEYAADAPRFNGAARRLLIGGQRTNTFTNPRLEGLIAGSPGTMPTGIIAFSPAASGLSMEIIGAVSAYGMQGMRVKLTAASTTAASAFWNFAPTTSGWAALPGQTWTSGFFLSLAAGSLAGLSLMRLSTGARNGAGANGASAASADIKSLLTGVPQRFVLTYSNLPTLTTGIIQGLRFDTLTSASPIDATIDVFWPTMEQGSFASSPILPVALTPAASTRGADLVSSPLATLGVGTDGACTILGTAMLPQNAPADAAQAVLQLDDGTDNNRFLFWNEAGSGEMRLYRVNAGVGASAIAGSMVAGTRFRFGIVIDGAGNARISLDGGAVVGVAGGVTGGLTTLRVGNVVSAAAPACGEIDLLRVQGSVSDAVLQQLVAGIL